MAIVSISKAAKLVGKSRTTLYNLIDSGELSKSTDPVTSVNGIDTSELVRVFGGLIEQPFEMSKPVQSEHNFTLEKTVVHVNKIRDLESELDKIKTVLEEKEKLLEAKQETIDSLNNAMRLLEDHSKKNSKEENPKGFLKRLFKY